ncbi:uncharacterized protein LOC125669859 [Ostrea edulis]|uniref:uncharacterized protein LOC125669859 n=1 Tax=Ostrea edulis TaxID=37623 RepID=UPI0024AFC9F2|nr:uncharacterized protein LOC125669859 [Ostrea edulis]
MTALQDTLSEHHVQQDITAVLEDLVEKCCKVVDGNKSSQNKPNSPENNTNKIPQLMNEVLNCANDEKECVEHIDENSVGLTFQSDGLGTKQDQWKGLVQVKYPSLYKENDKDIHKIMEYLLDRCCLNAQKTVVLEGTHIENQNVKDSTTSVKVMQEDEAPKCRTVTENIRTPTVSKDNSSDEENWKKSVSGECKLKSKSLLDRDEGNISEIHDKVNQTDSFVDINDAAAFKNFDDDDDDSKVSKSLFDGENLEREIESAKQSYVWKKCELVTNCMKGDSNVGLDEFDARAEEGFFNVNQKKAEMNIASGSVLSLSCLCKEVISINEQNHHKSKPDVCHLKHINQEEITIPHQTIKSEKPVTGNCNSDQAKNQEKLQEHDFDHFESDLIDKQEDICENKMTFIKHLGLSPLLVSGETEADTSPICLDTDKHYLSPSKPVESNNNSTELRDEVFEKIEIDSEEELHLEVAQMIPCKRMKMEDEVVMNDFHANQTGSEVCLFTEVGYENCNEKLLDVSAATEKNQNSKNVTQEDVKDVEDTEQPEVAVRQNSFQRIEQYMKCDKVEVTGQDDESSKGNGSSYLVNETICDHVPDDISLPYKVEVTGTDDESSKGNGSSYLINETICDHVPDDISPPSKLVSNDFDVMDEVQTSADKLENGATEERQNVTQSEEQLVPSTENIEQKEVYETESFYEEENTGSIEYREVKALEDEQKDSIHGVYDPGTNCFKWKYAPSYDMEDVVPNEGREEDVSPRRILPISSCKKPIRVGLSRKQQRLVSLHPYIKKH